MNTPALLVILDGWGIAQAGPGNALSLAKTPTMDRFDKEAIKIELDAAGSGVGLPEGHQGSSEMGHLMIGAGKPVVFPQTQVKTALNNNLVKDNPKYRGVMEYCRQENKVLHLFGLLSDRGVHAYADLCYQLLRLAKEMDVPRVAVHIISDGRDTTPCELPTFVTQLENVIQEIGLGEIASLVGRYYAMDRDQRWKRVEQAYRLYTSGEGLTGGDIHSFLKTYYQGDMTIDTGGLPYTDEFIPPTIFQPDLIMKSGDGVIFWNFRIDRAVEITQAFCEGSFSNFERQYVPVKYVATTKYYDEYEGSVAFEQARVEVPLGKVLADQGISQLRVAETEKWAYVTKVLDGYQEVMWPREEKVLIPSDKVATYDLQPEMQALAIAETIVDRLQKRDVDVIIANFANADMVGHTANMSATVRGIEAVDKALALIDEELQKQQGFMCITADHGNCERMLSPTGGKDGSHTANQVPFYIVNYHPEVSKKLLQNKTNCGNLTNVAPTFLGLLGAQVPEFMSSSLILWNNC